jgi:hypothetical protein
MKYVRIRPNILLGNQIGVFLGKGHEPGKKEFKISIDEQNIYYDGDEFEFISEEEYLSNEVIES